MIDKSFRFSVADLHRFGNFPGPDGVRHRIVFILNQGQVFRLLIMTLSDYGHERGFLTKFIVIITDL